MIKYTMKRILQSLITIFIVVSLIFILLQTAPMTGFGKGSTPSIIMLVNKLWKFWHDLILNGSFGASRLYVGRSVTSIIKLKMDPTLILMISISIINCVIGISLGMLYAKNRGKILDYFGYIYYTYTQCIPEIVIFLLFQLLFTRRIGLPIVYRKYNYYSWIIPILAGSFVLVAQTSFTFCRYMVDQLNCDYVKLARAKGLSEKVVLQKHVFRNVLVFLTRDLITSFFSIMTTTFFLEWVFAIPGISSLLFIAIRLQDSATVIGITTIITIASIFCILISDILVTIIDPRIEIN